MPSVASHSRTPALTWALSAMLVLLGLALLPACATSASTSHARRAWGLSKSPEPGLEFEASFSGGALWLEPDDPVWDEARRAEAARALDAVWGVAGSTHALGAEWEFRFWSQGGALTLLSLQNTEAGEERLAPISRQAFLPSLSRELPTLVGTNPREVTLELERQEMGWMADLGKSSKEEIPPYIRTLPLVHSGVSRATHEQVLNTARKIVRLMAVPRGGSAEFTVQVSLEDSRILNWEPKELDSFGSGPALSTGEEAVSLVVAVLLPFTQGLGERTLSLSLQAEHHPDEARPRWRIIAAHLLEPPPLRPQVADIHEEYRRLHESIIIGFQDEARETALLAAGFTLEQIAYSVVGGLTLKGAWVIIGKGAPTILSFLSKGGTVAVRWFRDLLVRAPVAEREALLRLWTKAEAQGIKALTAAEKQQFQALMSRLEKVLESPIGTDAKDELRSWSRKAYFELYRPEFAKRLGKEGLSVYEVHHLCPLEYAHLFPALDITGKANLTGLHKSVHYSISRVWSSLRPISGHMDAQGVERVMKLINRHYRRWFDKVYDPEDAAALARAEESVMGEIARLKARLSP